MKTWILPYIQLYKGRIALNILFGIIGVASGAMLLFVSGYLISKTALQPENILLVYIPIVAVRAFSIMQAVFPYLEKLTGHGVVLNILSHYRNRLYRIIEAQASVLSSRYQTGDLLGMVADDIEKLQDFFIRTLFPAISSVVIYIIMMIVFGIFDIPFMLLMFAVLGIIVFLVPYVSFIRMKPHHLAVKQKQQTLYQHVTDALFGQIDWIVSGRTPILEKEVAETSQGVWDEENAINQKRHIRILSLRFISGISIVLVLIWSNIQVNEEVLSGTVIAGFVLMMFSITDALLPMSETIEETAVYSDSLQRMNALAVEDSNEDQLAQHTGELSAHPTILLEDVYYRYEANAENAINHMNVTIVPGEKIALVGKSGSGKTTLLKLIAGVAQPQKGTVRLDDVQMQQRFLSDRVSVLNQHPHLFNTTIANNIRIGREAATDEEIMHVLQQVQLLDLIQTLPKGIHTNVEELGRRFSGGERQRIAFARVLIQNTPILLLDEPTTGMDPLTERALLKTIFEAAQEKTIIFVTHHLMGAAEMDRILFLENGEIKRMGSHRELMQTSTHYRHLYKMDTGY